jgi:hypothetical protein
MSMSQIEEQLIELTSMEKKIVKLGGKQWLLGIDGGLDIGTADNDSPVDLDSENEPSTSRNLASTMAAQNQSPPAVRLSPPLFVSILH